MPDQTTVALLKALDTGDAVTLEAFDGTELAVRIRRTLDDGRLLAHDRYIARDELAADVPALAFHLDQARRDLDEAVRIDAERRGGPS